MERRNWPWRKKASQKSPSTPPSQKDSSIPCSINSRIYDHHDSLENWERPEDVSEKLASALTEVKSKDDLVNQHAKVAEEAVCGWEKAETEATALKLQLETALHEKLAVEGALKECMSQLTNVREEHDKNLQETMRKNRKEVDKIKSDFEAKLVGKDQNLAEAVALNEALSRSLRERSRATTELSNSKSQVDTELAVLQMHLRTLEKENAALKYELQLLNKEIDIKNEEKQYRKREVDSANRKLLESTQKVAQLEAECQKLRVLVRRKLPGRAALAHMKLEVESTCSDTAAKYKRRSSNINSRQYGASTLEILQHRLQNGDREIQVLTEKMYAMEEENTLLREVLSRSSELDTKALGAKMAGNDFCVNGSKPVRGCGPASVVSMSDGSMNDDAASCSDAWPPVVDRLRKDTGKFSTERPPNLAKLDLMDDFVEMEQLASSACTKSECQSMMPEKKLPRASEAALDREKELQAAVRTASELQSKLASKEKELIELQKKNVENEVALISLQEKLDVKQEVLGGPAILKGKPTNDDALVNGKSPKASDNSSKNPYLGLEAVISRVLCLLEEIGNALSISAVQGRSQFDNALDPTIPNPTNTYFEESIRNAKVVSRKFLEGENSFKDFLKQMSDVLGAIKKFLVMHVEEVSVDHCNGKKNDCSKQENDCSRAKNQKGLEAATFKTAHPTVPTWNSQKPIAEQQDGNENFQQTKRQGDQMIALKCIIDNTEVDFKSENIVITPMQQKLAVLNTDFEDPPGLQQEDIYNIQKLQDQPDRSVEADLSSSRAMVSETSNPDAAQAKKEEKISAAVNRLEECQRTITALGEQLKALSSPREFPDTESVSTTGQEPSFEKVSKLADACYYLFDRNPKTESLAVSDNYKATPSHGCMMIHANQKFAHSPRTPPQQIKSSPYLQRGHFGSPNLQRAFDRQEKIDRFHKHGFPSPARSEHSYIVASPTTESRKFSSAMSPARFLSMRKKNSTANDLSKAFNAVSTGLNLEKHVSSSLSKLFSQAKT